LKLFLKALRQHWKYGEVYHVIVVLRDKKLAVLMNSLGDRPYFTAP
jgi:hypothetical protein